MILYLGKDIFPFTAQLGCGHLSHFHRYIEQQCNYRLLSVESFDFAQWEPNFHSFYFHCAAPQSELLSDALSHRPIFWLLLVELKAIARRYPMTLSPGSNLVPRLLRPIFHTCSANVLFLSQCAMFRISPCRNASWLQAQLRQELLESHVVYHLRVLAIMQSSFPNGIN